MNSYDILVIILSIALSIFLVLGIVFMSIMITLTKRINRLAEKAENVVDNLESLSQSAKKIASPLTIFATLAKLLNKK